MASHSLAALNALISRAKDDVPVTPTSQYGYVPHKSVCLIIVALFSISTLVHTAQAVKYRMWFIFPTIVLGGIGEIIGWSARLWSSFNPTLGTPFLIQISTTILAATPILAANFIIFGRVVWELGVIYIRLRPRIYSAVFLTADTTSLLIQGAGGAIASGAATLAGAERGAHVMLIGIVTQIVIIFFYVLLASEFFFRYFKRIRFEGRMLPTHAAVRGNMTKERKIMISALVFNLVFLFIRSMYRLIELSGGWTGRIIRTEIYFNVLDGGMVVLAMYTLNFFHPGMYLGREDQELDGKLNYAASSSTLAISSPKWGEAGERC